MQQSGLWNSKFLETPEREEGVNKGFGESPFTVESCGVGK
jgi:hypothetical protein